ncbi:hypothetical protein LTR66_016642, partial [Elasticomyces elasticus]
MARPQPTEASQLLAPKRRGRPAKEKAEKQIADLVIAEAEDVDVNTSTARPTARKATQATAVDNDPSAMLAQQLRSTVAELERSEKYLLTENRKLEARNAGLEQQVAVVQNLKDQQAELEARYKQRDAEYQALSAQKLQAFSGAIVSADDHDTIRLRATKAFATVSQFADMWYRPHAEMADIDERGHHRFYDGLMHKDNKVEKVACLRAVQALQQHLKGTKYILETLLNHFLCEEIVMHPFSIIQWVMGFTPELAANVQEIFKSISSAYPAKGIQASSMLMKCFEVDVHAKSKDAKKFNEHVLASKKECCNHLANKFVASRAQHIIKNIEEESKADFYKQLYKIIEGAVDFTIYLHRQGLFVRCIPFGTLTQNGVSLEYKTHERPHM